MEKFRTLETKPITPEKSRVQAKEELYLHLLEGAFELEKTVKEAEPEKPESEIHNIQFYFKKSWDIFTEPLFIYDELQKRVEDDKTISNSERKRQLHDLEERKIFSEKMVSQLIRSKSEKTFKDYSEQQKRAMLNKIYEGLNRALKGDRRMDDLREIFSTEGDLDYESIRRYLFR